MRDPSSDALVRELNADLLTGRLFHLASPEQGALVQTAVTACQAGRVVDAARAFITLHHGSGVPRFLACVEALAVYANGESDPWTSAAIYGLLFRYTADPSWEHRRQALLGQHSGRPASARNAPRGPLARPSMAAALGGQSPSPAGVAPGPTAPSPTAPVQPAASVFAAPSGMSAVPGGYGAAQAVRSPLVRASTPPPRAEPIVNRLGLPPVRSPQPPARAESLRASSAAVHPSLPGGFHTGPQVMSGPLVRGGWEPDLTPLPSGPPVVTQHPKAPPVYAHLRSQAPAPHAAFAPPGSPAPFAPPGSGVGLAASLGAPPAWSGLHPDYGDVTPAYAMQPSPQARGPAPWDVVPTHSSPPSADAFELAVELPVEHAPTPSAEARVAPGPVIHAPRWGADDGGVTDDGVDDLPGASTSPAPTRALSVDIPLAAPVEHDALQSIPLLPHVSADLAAVVFESPPAPRLMDMAAPAPRTLAHATHVPELSFEGLLGRHDEAPTQRPSAPLSASGPLREWAPGEFATSGFDRDGFPSPAVRPGPETQGFEDGAPPVNLPPLPDVFGASTSPGPRRPR